MDIAVKCSECGETTAVSEYIDPEMAKCRACGHKLDVPHVVVTGPHAAPVKEMPPSAAAMSPAAAKAFPPERTTMTVFRAMSRRKKRRRRILVWTPSGGTLLAIFLVVTGILSLLSYGPVLSASDLVEFKKLGMLCLGVGWLMVVVDAFNDNMMHGLLCIFVPFYFIYYLYWKCDSLLLRVGVGVFMIPFAPKTTVTVATAILKFLHYLGGSQFLNEDF